VSRIKRAAGVAVAAIPVVLPAGIALASGGGGEHGGDQLKDFLYRLLDFGVTFGVLFFLLRGPLKRALGARRQGVADELERARQMQQSAEQRYEACRQQLADADARIAKLTEDLQAEGAAQCARIEERARRMAEDIRRDAARGAQREIEAARGRLRDEAVRLAMELAEGRLREEIAPQDRARLVEEYLQKMAGEA